MSATSLLTASAGKTLVGVRRVLYVQQGAIKGAGGPLELSFDDGTSVVLDAGADGESLTVTAGAWADPFESPLTAENRLFVEASGKWTAFDVAAQDPYSRATGHQVNQVDDVKNPSDKVVGAWFRVGDVVLRASVDSDELLVDVA